MVEDGLASGPRICEFWPLEQHMVELREERMLAPGRAGALATLICGLTASPTPPGQSAGSLKPTPLILEKGEGERRVIRPYPGNPEPGEAFILKVDPRNGGSSHLVLLTAELAPGKDIEPHRHPNADEILVLHTGTARVHLADATKVVHSGAIVFIPANTWISVNNIGSDSINLTAVFSAPGFEDFMRDVSVREGEKNVPMSQKENDQVEKRHTHTVIYKQP
jgi:quercetin dioxygenase-like cupin family protein